jgi:hypothetical protein
LNAFGRQYRDNGYQLPGGAEDAVRRDRNLEPGKSENLTIFKEVPLSVRGQVFGLVPAAPEEADKPVYSNSIFAFLIGGGSVGRDVSYLFTWTPFPDADLHQARVGFHNLFDDAIGAGTLNVRAGSLFLLDFQRPGHRFLSPGAKDLTSLPVGNNSFNFAAPSLGIQAYGQPAWGPFHYELALVAGDSIEGIDKDDWQDVFSRVTVTAFQNTNHQVTPGAFAYVGRADTETPLGGLVLSQRDDFWIAGGDLEVDVGRFNFSGLGLARRDTDPAFDVLPQSYRAARGEVLWVPVSEIATSLRYEQVWSATPDLQRQALAPHLTWIMRQNVLLTGVWRQDLTDFGESSFVVVADTTF